MLCTWCLCKNKLSCSQCDAPCRQLSKLDQGMSSCGPSVRIIPPPPQSMQCIARFVCNPHAVCQQLLPSTCDEEFETFSQFLFAHMTTSRGATQQHPGQQKEQLPSSCSEDMFCGNGFCHGCVQRNYRASEKMRHRPQHCGPSPESLLHIHGVHPPETARIWGEMSRNSGTSKRMLPLATKYVRGKSGFSAVLSITVKMLPHW